ncbi:beta-L-arabinofuranosidase domain-containing protein [Microbacterium gilvum]|uniref:Glycoside hydrolase family 127 protein n=1 Tax=Microbacterium gilvum TaxID=1336204 RepID=A0ABP9AK95_9MICO
MKFFPADAVRVTDGPFASAIRTDLAYVLSLDADRLLAPFLREAGLAPDAPPYGNWEDSGLDGHTGGHWLSALAHLHAATGDPEPLQRLTAALDVLERAQDAVGTGWLGGVPGGASLFEALADGGVAAARSLGSSTHWVPWYNLHKTFQGLVDAHVVAGDARALRMAVRLADWWLAISWRMDDDAVEAMLDTEFGGMNEVFAELAALTGRDDLAAEALRFAHRAILDPLREGRDDLTGRHANTQIPKAVGYAATGDAEQIAAADVFWRTVVERRSVAIGGNSVREHFHDPADFAPMIEDREGPETCNTYNMLKLTRELAEARPRPELLDYAERALFNHVLSAQHPDGGFVYFTSMRPRHYRVYSQPQEGFWCCVGTGMEMQARYGEWIFGVEGGALAVNLFVPAELDANAFGVRLRMTTAFPADGRVSIAVAAEAPRSFALRLRVPSWAGALEDLRVNGEPAGAAAVDGAVIVERTWADGDELSFGVPIAVRAERLPDGSPWQAHLAGPLVLAARDDSGELAGLRADGSRMGHIAAGPLRPFADLPLVADGAGGVSADGPLRWRLATSGGEVELEPFAGIHDSRYTIYWPVDGPGRREALVAQDAHLALDAATVDVVAFGEQQPESDHAFAGDDSTVWSDGDARGRTLGSGVTVVLNDPAWHSRKLRIAVRSGGDAAIAIRLGDALVAEADVAPGVGALEFVIAPPAAGARLSLAPVPGRPAPVVTEARLLR